MSVYQLKISLVQSNPTVGGIDLNSECVLTKANEAEKKRIRSDSFSGNVSKWIPASRPC